MDSIIKSKRLIVLGSDHAGYKLKNIIKEYLTNHNSVEVIDVGTFSEESCDFPDYAQLVCQEVLKNEENRGILFCGSGIGVSIAANKIKGIRCALVHDHVTAKLAVEHTNCNVISIGENIVGQLVAKSIVDSFLIHKFLTDKKYQRRIDKITNIEEKNL
jgi:ribose 5-phosphate isomerase B